MDALTDLSQWNWPAILIGIGGPIGLLSLYYLLQAWKTLARLLGSIGVQVVMLVASLVVLFAFQLQLERATDLISLTGILLSAAIALSATTFLGNILAGLMLRAVKNFRPGDFISVSEYFGKVSERGLFHVEIQTVDRDLTTLPNIYLVTKPVTVTRSSGTMVDVDVSLGYDVERKKIRELLLRAAEKTGLEEGFVHVTNLGDFSVTYRVSGMLRDVERLITVRSLLREMVLDQLHGARIEIVSPAFMNQRALQPEQVFIPRRDATPENRLQDSETVVFDKANAAATIERLKADREAIPARLEALQQALKDTADSTEKDRLHDWIEQLKLEQETLAAEIRRREEELAQEGE